jgi:hypothetical protein
MPIRCRQALSIAAIIFFLTMASFCVKAQASTNPQSSPVRLVFIHHSCGENWLSDDNGGLGIALRDNNYFVSDTNYDWGPDAIGSDTDIGQWWLWFRGPDSPTILNALYAEGGQHCEYSRMAGNPPSGENQIIMFKSCFPNSALQGSINDPIPPIDSNPLRGQSSDSSYHTVANAKGIYIDLLEYFKTRSRTPRTLITHVRLTTGSSMAGSKTIIWATCSCSTSTTFSPPTVEARTSTTWVQNRAITTAGGTDKYSTRQTGTTA